MNAQFVIILVMVCALATLACSALLSLGLLRLPANETLQEVVSAIQEGLSTCLNRQTQTLTFVGAGFFLLIWAVLDDFRLPYAAVCFVVAALLSVLAGRIGLYLSLRVDLRMAVIRDLGAALETAFKGGAVTGLAIMGLSLFGITAFYLLYTALGVDSSHLLKALLGYGFGASLISLLVRVGGGIDAQAVGRYLGSQDPSSDDVRHPAWIATQVVGKLADCTGIAADLFETYGVTLIATMLLGSFAFEGSEILTRAVLFPLALAAAAMLAAVVAIWFVKLPAGSVRVMGSMYQGLAAAILLSALAFYLIARTCFNENAMGFYLVALIGLGLMLALTLSTEYYTSIRFKPVKSVAEQSRTGVAGNLISGLAVGFESTLAPFLLICVGMLAAYGLAGGSPSHPLVGLYGVAVLATSVVSGCGMVAAMAAFAPMTRGAVVEMAGMPAGHEVTAALDAVADTTQAVTRGYALVAAGLAALVLFFSYTQQMDAVRAARDLGPVPYLLSDPRVLAGLLLGTLLPCCFFALLLNSGAKAGGRMRNEVKRQFEEIPGILDGSTRPEYGRCVELVTQAAWTNMLPALLAVLTPVLVGAILGPLTLGGLLVGSLLTGLLLAVFTTTAGAAWGNARKYVELGYFGGKGSETHLAAVAGDAVGTLCKETAGLALNPLLKMMNLVSLLVVSRIAGGSLFGL